MNKYDWECQNCGHQWEREDLYEVTPAECPACTSIGQVITVGDARENDRICGLQET